MSIDDLERRLAQRTLQIEQTTFPEPVRLIRSLERVEQRFNALESEQPSVDRMLAAVELYERLGVTVLTKRRDWKNVAWGLCATFQNRPSKLIFLNQGHDLLWHISTKQKDIIPVIYIPLLFGYFSLKDTELQQYGNKNWLVLRNILDSHREVVYQQNIKRPKEWMSVLREHSDLLKDEPTKMLSLQFINSTDDKKIPAIAEKLRIPTNSWFWDRLIEGAIESVCSLGDQAFLDKLDRLLNIAESNPTFRVLVLTKALDRYAQSSKRDEVHERLKSMALEQWGSPQYNSSAGWSNVKSETKQMVIQWIVRADLEAFFRLFSEAADVNRFNYWIKFIDRISFSQIFLGQAALHSQRHDHRKYREANRGRLKNLSGSSSSNNAFLLKIDNVYVVDFSQTGNSCFAYRQMPYKDSDSLIYIDDLKNKRASLFRNKEGKPSGITHIGDWERKFDRELARIGISSNPNNLGRNTTFGRSY